MELLPSGLPSNSDPLLSSTATELRYFLLLSLRSEKLKSRASAQGHPTLLTYLRSPEGRRTIRQVFCDISSADGSGEKQTMTDVRSGYEFVMTDELKSAYDSILRGGGSTRIKTNWSDWRGVYGY